MQKYSSLEEVTKSLIFIPVLQPSQMHIYNGWRTKDMSSFTPKLQSHHFHFKLRRWRSIRAGRRPKVRLSFIPKLHPSSFHFKLEVRLRSIRAGRRLKVRLSLTPKLQSSSFHFKLSICRSIRAGKRPKVRLSVTPELHPSSSQKHIHPRLPPSVMHT